MNDFSMQECMKNGSSKIIWNIFNMAYASVITINHTNVKGAWLTVTWIQSDLLSFHSPLQISPSSIPLCTFFFFHPPPHPTPNMEFSFFFFFFFMYSFCPSSFFGCHHKECVFWWMRFGRTHLPFHRALCCTTTPWRHKHREESMGPSRK